MVRLTDVQLKVEELGLVDPLIFGGAQLNEKELSILRLRPEYALFGKVTCQRMEEQVQAVLTKLRWTRMNKGSPAEQMEAAKEEEEGEPTLSREELELSDAKARQTYCPDTNTINMGRKKATDMPNNRRVFMPPPRPVKEESLLAARKNVWDNVTNDFIGKGCDKDGNQVDCNLIKGQREGLRMLRKRIKEGELVVCKSDKGKRLTVITPGLL